MRKSKILSFALIINLSIVLSWPQYSQAFSLFGTSDAQQTINYLKGYNDAWAKIAIAAEEGSALPISTKTKKTVVPKSITGTTTSTATSTNVYVANPMTANLDVGNYRIGSYTGLDHVVYLDSSMNIGNNYLYGGNVNLTTMEANRNPLRVNVLGNNSTGGSFVAWGANSAAIRAFANNTSSPATYAGLFEGHVKVFNGNLIIEDNVNIGPALPGKSTVMDEVNNGIAFSAAANGDNAKAGFFQANGHNSYAVYGIASPTSSYAGYFDGKVYLDRIGNYGGTENTIYVDSNLNISGYNLYGDNVNLTTMEANRNPFIARTTGANSVSGNFISAGSDSIALRAVSTGNNSYAGYFDGKVKLFNGGLTIDHGTLRVDSASSENPAIYANVIVDGATAFMASANTANSTAVMGSTLSPGGVGVYGRGAYGDSVVNNYAGKFDGNVFIEYGKLGIGVANPNANLHIKTASGNAELDIQSGNNTHWGIYQNSLSGTLNFWHGDNRLILNDRGISTNGICLSNVCVTNWQDLKSILNINPTPTGSKLNPNQQP
ncbi:MAG: hypothetical protein WC465_04315 [Patescibacteria group bacterium]